MSNLYENTTESLESLHNITCTTKLTGCTGYKSPGGKNKKADNMQMTNTSLDTDQDRTDFDQPSMGIAAGGSEYSFDPYDSDVQINQPRLKLNRAKSIQWSMSVVAKNTLDFFGVTEAHEQEERRQKWNQRRIRHLSRLGKVKESASRPSTPDTADGPRFASIVHAAMAKNNLTQMKSRRTNAATLLWKTASRRLSAKPQFDVSTIQSYGGRSFAPADLDDDISVFGSMSHLSEDRTSRPITPVTPSFIDDRSFFQFDTIHPSTIEEEDTLDETDGGIRDEAASREMSVPPSPTPYFVSSWDSKQLGPEPTITLPGPKHVSKPDYLRQPSERRRRIQTLPFKKLKQLKREFGKGLVGNLLNRTFNRSRINSKVREQMEDIQDHRPYFTYWLSFIQVVIIIVMISVYPFAPVGVSQKNVKQNVLVSRNGVLQTENVQKKVVESFWIGPTLQTLILLGAKYAPCMRRDKRLYRQLDKERNAENKTGCCIQTFNTGCIQRQQGECTSSFTRFKPKTVCGQDPRTCLSPASKPPNEWDKNTITKWPVCTKTVNISSLNKEKYPHMRCEITGRPCCIGTQAQCITTSQDYCQFRDGVYHSSKTLCSQVDCLSSTCGLLPFINEDQPDQFYRLWLSLFLNAGILHVAIVLVFNFTILRDIEKMAGWLRTSLIFIISGIGGNLWSSIIIPYEPEVGPSGAAFGIISCVFVELIQSWQLIQQPFKALGKLCGIMLLLFLLGLLPYIDNFAHIFGFIYGFFSALIFLPYLTFGAWDRRRKQIQIVAAISILLLLTIVGFVVFYERQEFHSNATTYFNCVPITEDFCKNFHQGQLLEKRPTDY